MLKRVKSLANNWSTRLYVRTKSALESAWSNQNGGVSLEWIALGVLVIAILGAIAAYFSKDGSAATDKLGQAVSDVLEKLMKNIGNSSGNGSGTP